MSVPSLYDWEEYLRNVLTTFTTQLMGTEVASKIEENRQYLESVVTFSVAPSMYHVPEPQQDGDFEGDFDGDLDGHFEHQPALPAEVKTEEQQTEEPTASEPAYSLKKKEQVADEKERLKKLTDKLTGEIDDFRAKAEAAEAGDAVKVFYMNAVKALQVWRNIINDDIIPTENRYVKNSDMYEDGTRRSSLNAEQLNRLNNDLQHDWQTIQRFRKAHDDWQTVREAAKYRSRVLLDEAVNNDPDTVAEAKAAWTKALSDVTTIMRIKGVTPKAE